MTITRAHFVLYVRDQRASTEFYRRVLANDLTLDVPSRTEFAIMGGAILGLMPESGIARLLGGVVDPAAATPGATHDELYLLVYDPAISHARALAAVQRRR